MSCPQTMAIIINAYNNAAFGVNANTFASPRTLAESSSRHGLAEAINSVIQQNAVSYIVLHCIAFAAFVENNI